MNPDSHDLNGIKDSTTACTTQENLSLYVCFDVCRSDEENQEDHIGKKIMISGMKTK